MLCLFWPESVLRPLISHKVKVAFKIPNQSIFVKDLLILYSLYFQLLCSLNSKIHLFSHNSSRNFFQFFISSLIAKNSKVITHNSLMFSQHSNKATWRYNFPLLLLLPRLLMSELIIDYLLKYLIKLKFN